MPSLFALLFSYPRALRWVRHTVLAHRDRGVRLDLGVFPQLAAAFHPDQLETVRIITLDAVPRPPLDAWGLHAVDGLVFADADGLTLGDLIFVRRGAESPSLLFHELVHVCQWRVIGERLFLAMYGLNLLNKGYDRHPLELMAYELQRRFDRQESLADAWPVVARRTQEFLAASKRESWLHRAAFLAAQYVPVGGPRLKPTDRSAKFD